MGKDYRAIFFITNLDTSIGVYAASWLPFLHLRESTSGSQLYGRLHPLEKSLVCLIFKGSSE
jgi:hypothetical protein